MNNCQKKIIGKIIEILHIIGYFYLIIAPFFTKNIKLLLIIASIHATIIFLWYNTGDCILTPLENWLLGKENIKHDKSGNVSNVFIFTKKITGLPDKVLNQFFLYLPIVMIYIISYKIYLVCNC